MVLAKRGLNGKQRTNIAERWASFDQMRMVKMKVIDSDALDNISTENNPKEKTTSGYKKIKVNLEDLTNSVYDSSTDQAEVEKKKVVTSKIQLIVPRIVMPEN